MVLGWMCDQCLFENHKSYVIKLDVCLDSLIVYWWRFVAVSFSRFCAGLICVSCCKRPFLFFFLFICSLVETHTKTRAFISWKQKQQMSDAVAAVSWRAALVPGGQCRFERHSVEVSPKWWCNVKQLRVMKVKAQMVNPCTCSSRISIDIPLHEIPGVNTPTLSSLCVCVWWAWFSVWILKLAGFIRSVFGR